MREFKMSNYSRIKFCASWAMVLVLVFVLGCSPEEPQGTLVSQSATSYSKVNGKRYAFEISNKAILLKHIDISMYLCCA